MFYMFYKLETLWTGFADILHYCPLLPGAGLVPGGGVLPGLDAVDTGVGVAGVRAVAVGDTLVLAAWVGLVALYTVHCTMHRVHSKH